VYAARGTYIYPPTGALRIITDVFAFCTEHVPAWNTISISGYHMREGARPRRRRRPQRVPGGDPKFRAARRMWAYIMRERFGSKKPRAQMVRFHAQTAGSSLTAQQPDNNIVRTPGARRGAGRLPVAPRSARSR
jgi:methylmalonyl-CoA mutase N-terminal domain/subunit